MGELTKQDQRGLATTLAGGVIIAVAVRGPTSTAVLVGCGAVVFLIGLLQIRFQ